MKDYPPGFDFDPLKSLLNWWKHGQLLAFASVLWLDPKRIYLNGKVTNGETRFRIVAQHEGKIWTCVFTLREGTFRLISVRRAWKVESHAYKCGRTRPPSGRGKR